MKSTQTKEVKKTINKSQNIAIFWHSNIDWDALWSILSIGSILEKKWKKVKYFTPTKVSPYFNFVKWQKKVKNKFDYKNYDLLIFCDFSDYKRINQFTKGKEDYFNESNLVIIDHHEWNYPKHAKCLRDPKANSTCDIIVEYCYKRRKKYFNAKIASYLFLGISTDTGNFMYGPNQESIKTFQHCTKLLKLWADKQLIVDKLYNQRNLNRVKFIWFLWEKVTITNNILYTYFNENDLQTNNIELEEAKSIFDAIIKKIDGPIVYILLREQNWQVKWSVRNSIYSKNLKKKKPVDCAKLSKDLFNGGGHKEAAGFTIEKYTEFDKEIKKIISKVKKNLKEQSYI